MDSLHVFLFFFFNDTATTEIYTLSLHDALPISFLLFVVLILVGSSNAVNLTDGLDGLAIGCVIVAGSALTVLTYVTGHAAWSRYLDLEHLPLSHELTIFCGSMVGSSLGFLWYNAFPAEIFMGD